MHLEPMQRRRSLLFSIWQFGMLYAAVDAVWQQRWVIAAAAVAGGLAAVLIALLILRGEGRG